jgi:starch phosphorylase
MRESMALLTPEFSANRAVRQYTDNYYLPAANALRERSKDNAALGNALLHWQCRVSEHWPRLRFGDSTVESDASRHVVHVQAYLDELDPAAVRVELCAEGRAGGQPVRVVMERGDPLIGSMNAYTFTASVPADRPATDFTPRLVPFHPAASIPLEANQILWYK